MVGILRTGSDQLDPDHGEPGLGAIAVVRSDGGDLDALACALLFRRLQPWCPVVLMVQRLPREDARSTSAASRTTCWSRSSS